MRITKSNWQSDDNRVRLAMPIEKVDKENRLVHGWATLDNVDAHGDVVLAEASNSAFSRFRGNIREMHQPIAAGRMVDFKIDEFYDQEDDKFYTGVYVTAYVSKGAQDTWEKVLDGTLTGFSIGGEIRDSETEWVKDANANIRFIKDYDLTELSLVDNPANQKANLVSIQKTADGAVLEGDSVRTKITNVFWCSTDKASKTSTSESAVCHRCESEMENIGWFESDENVAEKVRAIVSKHLNATEGSEGGVTMSDENKEETVEETAAPVDEVTEEETAEEAPVEEETAAAEPVEEVNTDEPDIQKMFDELSKEVSSHLEKSTKVTEEAVAAVEEKIETVTKSMDDKISSFESKLNELGGTLEALKGSSDEVAKRLDALESETAMKKSGDVDSSEDNSIRKSADDKTRWKGAFLDLSDM